MTKRLVSFRRGTRITLLAIRYPGALGVGKSLCLQPLLLLSFTTSTPCESGLESTLVNPDEVKLLMSSTGDQTGSSRKEGPSPSQASWSELDNPRSDITFLAPTVTSAGMPKNMRNHHHWVRANESAHSVVMQSNYFWKKINWSHITFMLAPK